ncbi:FAD-dependent oxidoreductase [Chelativorans sp. AA-79]|uniref:dihydrolipoyl dehydrogenase family protein n=1 Tax=Chelativorans sp. AA-79 TaxID=3028735 RepID=UPI0023F8C422|nr:FAD-dependent oxidoreductase [Chelativorans sp. AA-79]WEX08483.1 FAD-dependent oxidoreductase [Chelativorans sp. AA-79]
MTRVLKPDICIIGAGSGGLTVAAAAASLGVPVVLVERGRMGGDCLNYGCIPSKALIASGKQAHRLRHGAPLGIANVEPSVDFARVAAHIEGTIAAIAPNDSVERFTSMGVTVVPAEASFKNTRTVVAGAHEIKARRFVIAAGSSPAIPPIPGLDEVPFLTNETVFSLRRQPEHLIVIGGGPVGMELAQAHRRLGARVTVIEAGTALGKEDSELSKLVVGRLRAEGVEIFEHTHIQRVEPQDGSGIRVLAASAGGPKTIDGSHLLVATGRRPNLDALALDRAGIAFGADGITVSNGLRTTNRRVYAIGDVAGGPQFTHVANYHAGLVVRAILFRLPAKADRNLIPRVTFTDPELAHIGLTEDEVRKNARHVKVLRAPFSENDRAQTEGLTEGFVKLVVGRHGRILGASMVGPGAGELLHFWSLALSKRMTVRDVARYVAPYPTLGEIGKRAAFSALADAARSSLVRGMLGFLRLFG